MARHSHPVSAGVAAPFAVGPITEEQQYASGCRTRTQVAGGDEGDSVGGNLGDGTGHDRCSVSRRQSWLRIGKGELLPARCHSGGGVQALDVRRGGSLAGRDGTSDGTDGSSDASGGSQLGGTYGAQRLVVDRHGAQEADAAKPSGEIRRRLKLVTDRAPTSADGIGELDRKMHELMIPAACGH